MTGGVYAFGRFRLDADERVLFRDQERISITPKAVDLLLTLLEHRGAMVPRQELFLRVWSDAVVEEGTLSSHVSILRKILGGQFIETIPKRGYRFVGIVEETGGRRSLLVVLPFENLTDKRADSFADGLTEELIAQLGRLNPQRLGVIARTSSMTYKSTDKTVAQIGRELNVSYLLEGSVRRADNRIRITAQLIQVSDQTHVWADTYESDLEDILSVQSRVSREVANQIEIRLLPHEQVRMDSAKPVVAAAYDAYLTGRYLWNRRGEKDLRMSISSFEKAIHSDPDYAPPYAGLADACLSLMDSGYLSHSETMAISRPLLERALQLDEGLAEAHVSLGHTALHEFDWPTAQRELLRGIELNPSASTARHYYANYLAAMVRMDEATAQAEEAVRLDPVSAAVHSNLSSMMWFAGDNARSIAQARRALELNPGYSRCYEDLGRAYEQSGQFDSAIEAFRKGMEIEQHSDGTLSSLAHTYAIAGRRSEAMKILRRLHRTAKTRFVGAHSLAVIFVALGEIDDAFTWFDKAFDEHSSALPFLRVNPRLAPLRSDLRFAKLLRRIFG